jgi:CRISPR-associated protein Cmr4
MTDALLFLYAETQVHAGGPESIGAIDLPIQRARHSGHPVIWGQSVKGALKDHARRRKLFGDTLADLAEVMGGDPQDNRDGWLAVSDARLVAFPVPTLEHCFAWVASPAVLAGVARYAARCGGEDRPPAVPLVGDGLVALAATDDWDGDEVCVGSYLCRRDRPETHDLAAGWAGWAARNALPDDAAFAFFRDKLTRHLMVVDDATFTALTEEFAEVAPRIQLTVGTKTANELFYEENLPSETIMVTVLSAMRGPRRAAEAAAKFHGEIVTLGGSETVGRGLLWVHDPTRASAGGDR